MWSRRLPYFTDLIAFYETLVGNMLQDEIVQLLGFMRNSRQALTFLRFKL